MSACFKYEMLGNKSPYFSAYAPTSLIEALEKVFGPYPWKLTKECLPKLRTIEQLEICAGSDIANVIKLVKDNAEGIELRPSWD